MSTIIGYRRNRRRKNRIRPQEQNDKKKNSKNNVVASKYRFNNNYYAFDSEAEFFEQQSSVFTIDVKPRPLGRVYCRDWDAYEDLLRQQILRSKDWRAYDALIRKKLG